MVMHVSLCPWLWQVGTNLPNNKYPICWIHACVHTISTLFWKWKLCKCSNLKGKNNRQIHKIKKLLHVYRSRDVYTICLWKVPLIKPSPFSHLTMVVLIRRKKCLNSLRVRTLVYSKFAMLRFVSVRWHRNYLIEFDRGHV